MPILGDGVKIGYETGSPLAFSEIPDLDEISGIPIPVADELETTTHGTNGYHTFGDGLLRIEPFTTTHLYDGADTAIDAVVTAAMARSELNIRLEVPADSSKTTFKALEMTAKVSAALAAPKDNWQRWTFTWKYASGYDTTDWTSPAASEIT